MEDNSVTGSMYHWVNSSNNDIFELMLRIIYLDLRGCFRLHIIRVAVTVKIVAGIYGCSRGRLKYGVATSGLILYILPLNETEFEYSITLLT